MTAEHFQGGQNCLIRMGCFWGWTILTLKHLHAPTENWQSVHNARARIT